MTVVRVAIPVLRATRKFHIEKGRPWSVVEHLLLQALVKRPRTAAELGKAGNLHQRLVVESLVRLMRAGWVELSHEPQGVIFNASGLGIVAAASDELPAAMRRIKRWMSFVVDRVTGCVYRRAELTLLEQHILAERATRERVVWVEARQSVLNDDIGSVLSTLLENDEQFLGVDPAGDRPVDRWALFTVRDGVVEGLPQRAPTELGEVVLSAAATMMGSHPILGPNVRVRPQPAPDPAGAVGPVLKPMIFSSSDLVVGGASHEQVFGEVLKRARRRLLILSTFIRLETFNHWWPMMLEAVKRGVLIDVFWGQETRVGHTGTRDVVNRLREDIQVSGFGSYLRIHPFSTNSHAKIMVFDDGRTDQIYALIGSCNWLSSAYEAFEVSAKLRDPTMVADVIMQMANLSRGPDKQWHELTGDLARWSREVALMPKSGGVQALGALVIGPQHVHFVRRARDEAKSNLFVTSHRMGTASGTVIVPPAIAAVRERGIDAQVFYGMMNPETASSAAKVVTAAIRAGVDFRAVHEPLLHAKILAWDEDNLLVTSRNWLSADTSESNPAQEIGVFVHGRGIARLIIQKFAAARL